MPWLHPAPPLSPINDKLVSFYGSGEAAAVFVWGDVTASVGPERCGDLLRLSHDDTLHVIFHCDRANDLASLLLDCFLVLASFPATIPTWAGSVVTEK